MLRASSLWAAIACVLLLSNHTFAQKSILVKSTTSVTSTSAGSTQPVSAASETVTSEFRPAQQSTYSENDSSGAIKLKWRARHPNSFALNETGQQPQVQQVSQVVELNDADPFADPFEDRTQGRFSSAQVQPFDAQPSDTQPQPEVRPLFGQNVCAGCPEKCFNGRNCCNEEKGCSQIQQMLGELTIHKISLNISPTINPAAETAAELEEERNNRLIQAATRVWRDVDGNELVEGNLVNFQDNRVFIATADGGIEKLSFSALSNDDRCFVAAWWRIPAACRAGNEKYVARAHVPMTMTWTASQACHKPLYFEEIALERYGHTSGPLVQPWVSGAHFFTNIAILPYKMGINPLNECQYDLGYYRPGDCAPWLLPPVPLSPRGALFQAGAVTGVSYLIP